MREGRPKYLVWSNEHRAWWGADRRGYTRVIERAGRYDRDEAFSIARTRDGGWPREENPYEIAILEADAVEQYAALRSMPGGRRMGAPADRHNQLAPNLLIQLIEGTNYSETEALVVLESITLGVLKYFRPNDARAQVLFLETMSEALVERIAA